MYAYIQFVYTKISHITPLTTMTRDQKPEQITSNLFKCANQQFNTYLSIEYYTYALLLLSTTKYIYYIHTRTHPKTKDYYINCVVISTDIFLYLSTYIYQI